jgi:hypothetical protein
MHTRRSRVTGSNRNCPRRGTIHIAVHPGQPLQFRSTITLGPLSPSAAAHTNGTPLSGSLMSLLIVWSLIEHPPVISRRIGAFFGADPGPFASTSLRSACNKSGAAALDHGVSVSETRRESGVGRSVAGAIQARPMLALAGLRIRITRTADDRAYRGDLCRRFWQGWSLTRSWVRLGRHGRPSRASPACRLTPHQRRQSRRQLARWLCANNRPGRMQQAACYRG